VRTGFIPPLFPYRFFNGIYTDRVEDITFDFFSVKAQANQKRRAA
jgi:hypothetical protein